MVINLSRMLYESARARPNHTLIQTSLESFNFADVDKIASQVARATHKLGLVQGDRVALRMPNVPEFIPIYFGLLKAGLVVVLINPSLSPREVARLIDDSQANAIIILEGDVLTDGHIECPLLLTVRTRHASGTPRPSHRVKAVIDFTTLIERQSPEFDIVPVCGDSTAVIIYTSGSSGTPKGVELSHLQLFLTTLLESDWLELGPKDVILGALPLFHLYALSVVLHSAVMHSATIYLMARFDCAEIISASNKFGISILMGVPTMYFDLLHETRPRVDGSTWRIGMSGGAPMPLDVITQLGHHFPNMQYIEGWGMTETSASGTLNGGPHEFLFGSVGRPLWGSDIAIADPSGRHLPAGKDNVGELLFRGHGVMKGYFNQPEATAQVMTDGWLHTGDAAYIDDDGYVFIVGRIKDMIIRGGYNVYPREIEEVLHNHPSIAIAAVIGVPDSRLGEEIVAFVKTSENAALSSVELIEYCKQHLAHYKYPRSVIFLNELPTGATGKIDVRKLRQLLP